MLQEQWGCWSGLPFPPPGVHCNLGIQSSSPVAPALLMDSWLISHKRGPKVWTIFVLKYRYSKYSMRNFFKKTLIGGTDKNKTTTFHKTLDKEFHYWFLSDIYEPKGFIYLYFFERLFYKLKLLHISSKLYWYKQQSSKTLWCKITYNKQKKSNEILTSMEEPH